MGLSDDNFSSLLYLNLFAVMVQLTIVGSLLFRKNNTMANRLLALIMFYPTIGVVFNIVFIIFRNHNLLFLSPVNVAIALTFGPVLLLYVRMLFGKTATNSSRYYAQFIPSGLILLSSAYYFFITEQERKVLLDKLISGEDVFTNFINLLLLCHIMIYLVLAHRAVKLYKTEAKNFLSHINDAEIKWATTIVKYIALLNILLLSAYALPVIITGKSHIYSDLIAAPVVSVMLYLMMIYKGFSYHAIFDKSSYLKLIENSQQFNSNFKESELEKEEVRQSSINMDDHKTKEIRDCIEKLFTEAKIHKQCGLKLHTVAQMLNMSPALLSRFINTCFQTTFFDLVNNYRIEEAKELLLKPEYQHLKIESIGEMAGFSSRASFFSVFRKYTGETPSAFKGRKTQF